jgi:hypothetical protein
VETLDDLRASAHSGVETIVDLKMREIEKKSWQRRECDERNSISRGDLELG